MTGMLKSVQRKRRSHSTNTSLKGYHKDTASTQKSPRKSTALSRAKKIRFDLALKRDSELRAKRSKPESKNTAISEIETNRITVSQRLFNTHQARRQALKKRQGQQSSLKTEHEPDLNDEKEVRYFDVDEMGNLTFILFDTNEAWMLREIPWNSSVEKIDSEADNVVTQVVAGRLYAVKRV